MLAGKAKEVAMLVASDTFSGDLQKWLGADATLATKPSADAIAEAVARKVSSTADELGTDRPVARARPGRPQT
jgi:hypothetical protein